MSKNELLSRQTQAFPRRPVAAQPAAAPAQTRVVIEDDSTPQIPPPSSLAQTNPSPSPSTGPLAVEIHLPSRFEFYDFDRISVLPIRGHHQALMYRAAHEKSDQHVANAISSLLPNGLKSEELTIPDFYFVMYWLRLNCYTKTSLVHRGVCNSPAHLTDVREGRKTKESLVTVTTIPKTWLDQTELPEDYLSGFEEELRSILSEVEPLGYTLNAPRMFDTIELHDTMFDNPEYDMLSYHADRAACLVKADGVRDSLAARISVVQDLSIDTLDLLDQWRVRVSMYGVKEVVRFKCTECGADVENPVLLSAHAFL